MTHEEVGGVQVGQHELVSRFMKGIFNCNPPAPRYTSTWDVDVVLKYLSSLPENTHLPLALTHKIAMLSALCSANHCSELAPLDLNFCSIFENGIKFIILGPTRQGKKVLLGRWYSENKTLCPISSFWSTRNAKANSVPKNEGEDRLFITVRKPHQPVTSVTIGHSLAKHRRDYWPVVKSSTRWCWTPVSRFKYTWDGDTCCTSFRSNSTSLASVL